MLCKIVAPVPLIQVDHKGPEKGLTVKDLGLESQRIKAEGKLGADVLWRNTVPVAPHPYHRFSGNPHLLCRTAIESVCRQRRQETLLIGKALIPRFVQALDRFTADLPDPCKYIFI